MAFRGLVKETQHCKRLCACGSANTRWEPWHVRDLRVLSDVLRLRGPDLGEAVSSGLQPVLTLSV